MKPSILSRVAAVILLTAAPCLLHAQCADLPIGTWEWVSSTGGFGGDTRTPATAGYTVQFEFLASGTVKEYRDEELVKTQTWTLDCSDPELILLTYPEADPSDFATYTAWFTVLPGGQRVFERYPYLVWDGYLDRYVERGAIVGVDERTWGAVKGLFAAP